MLLHNSVFKTCLDAGRFSFVRTSYGNHIQSFHIVVLGVFKIIIFVENWCWEVGKLWAIILIQIEVSDHGILRKHFLSICFVSNKILYFQYYLSHIKGNGFIQLREWDGIIAYLWRYVAVMNSPARKMLKPIVIWREFSRDVV